MEALKIIIANMRALMMASTHQIQLLKEELNAVKQQTTGNLFVWNVLLSCLQVVHFCLWIGQNAVRDICGTSGTSTGNVPLNFYYSQDGELI